MRRHIELPGISNGDADRIRTVPRSRKRLSSGRGGLIRIAQCPQHPAHISKRQNVFIRSEWDALWAAFLAAILLYDIKKVTAGALEFPHRGESLSHHAIAKSQAGARTLSEIEKLLCEAERHWQLGTSMAHVPQATQDMQPF